MAPKEINIPNNVALEKLEEFKNNCIKFREREEEYKFGLDIFDIEQTDYKELAQVEKENGVLFNIWNIK